MAHPHAGRDGGCESDDDAHMGDDPEQRSANSNGTTNQALRSAGNMAFHRAVRAGDGSRWQPCVYPAAAFVTGDE
jgi:hypothetical protein